MKLTRAKVSQKHQGTIEAEGSVEYLMSYAADESATFVGLELVRGAVAGKRGSFVIRHSGAYEGGQARSSWDIVPGSGSGELTGLRGEGKYIVGHAEPASVSFRYRFESTT